MRHWRCAALAALLTSCVAERAAVAGITNISAYNSASNYGEFTYSYDSVNYSSAVAISEFKENTSVNTLSYVYGSYSYEFWPQLYTSAEAYSSTDYSSYVMARAYAGAYADANSYYGAYAYAQASAMSYVNFTITTESDAELYISAYAAASDNAGTGYEEAAAYAYLYNYSTSAYEYFYAASATNGQTGYNEYYAPVVLAAGDYRIGFTSAYAYGASNNWTGYYSSEGASATVQIYNIRDVVHATASVPEPAGLTVWGLGLVGFVGMTLCKRKQAT